MGFSGSVLHSTPLIVIEVISAGEWARSPERTRMRYCPSVLMSLSPDVTVAINRADGARSVNIPAGSYTNLLTDAAVSGGSVSVPARDYLILGRR